MILEYNRADFHALVAAHGLCTFRCWPAPVMVVLEWHHTHRRIHGLKFDTEQTRKMLGAYLTILKKIFIEFAHKIRVVFQPLRMVVPGHELKYINQRVHSLIVLYTVQEH